MCKVEREVWRNATGTVRREVEVDEHPDHDVNGEDDVDDDLEQKG